MTPIQKTECSNNPFGKQLSLSSRQLLSCPLKFCLRLKMIGEKYIFGG